MEKCGDFIIQQQCMGLTVMLLIWNLVLSSTAGSVARDEVTACYGSLEENYLSLQCKNTTEVIAVHGVKVGAKVKSLNCTVVRDACCKQNETTDCQFNYLSNTDEKQRFYHDCQGRSTCLQHAEWSNISPDKCNTSNYPATTVYMTIEYECVKTESILNLCANGSTKLSGNPVYIVSPDYPNSLYSETNCGCYIFTNDNKTKIKVKVLDLWLSNNGSQSCFQSLSISGNNESYKQSCTNKASVGFKTLYEATSSEAVHIEYTKKNSIQGTAYMWLEVSANDTNTKLQVVCGENVQTTTPEQVNTTEQVTTPTEQVNTTEQVTTPTEQVGTTPEQPTTTTVIRTSTEAESHKEKLSEDSLSENEKTGIIVGVVVAVILIIACTALLVFHYKSRKKHATLNEDVQIHQMKYSAMGKEDHVYDNIVSVERNFPNDNTKSTQIYNSIDEAEVDAPSTSEVNHLNSIYESFQDNVSVHENKDNSAQGSDSRENE